MALSIEEIDRRVARLERFVEENGWREHRRQLIEMTEEWGNLREWRGRAQHQLTILSSMAGALLVTLMGLLIRYLWP